MNKTEITKMSLRLKPLAITMGDPSGIGPEIIVSSFEKESSNFNAIVLGCPNTMKRAVKINHSKYYKHYLD